MCTNHLRGSRALPTSSRSKSKRQMHHAHFYLCTQAQVPWYLIESNLANLYFVGWKLADFFFQFQEVYIV